MTRKWLLLVLALAAQRVKKSLQSIFESGYTFDIESLKKQYSCSVLLKDGAEHVLLCPRNRLSEAMSLLRSKGMHASVAAEHADYERRHANRKTVLNSIETKLC